MAETVVILGCGYTGQRVARQLVAQGVRVIGAARHAFALPGVEFVRFDAAAAQDLSFVPAGARLLYSIPALDPDPAPELIPALAAHRLARLVYLSSTSVYGATPVVDEQTAVAPDSAAARARVRAEQTVLGAACPAMVLRPAAIYGPGRGVHVRMREGTFRLAGDGRNYTSRIHVDDLATLCVAALFSSAGGAWPVADAEPCLSREIASFCAELLGVPMAASAPPEELHATRRADRRVHGGAVLRLLGVRLRYPTYRQGIPASAGSAGESQILPTS